MNCIDNGMHSFKKSLNKLFELDRVKDDDLEFYLKDIILDLHHSLEILCKYLVEKKSKYFVYEDIFKAFEKELNIKLNNNKNNNELQTIKFIDAINRVLILYNQDIDEHTYGMFKELNKWRNALSHYEVTIKRIEVEFLISSVLPIIINIFSKNISEFNDFVKISEVQNNIENIYHKRNVWRLTSIIDLISRYKDCEICTDTFNNKDKISLIDKNDIKIIELIGYDHYHYFSLYDFLVEQLDKLILTNHSDQLLDSIITNDKTKFFLKTRSNIIENIVIDILHSKIIYSIHFFIKCSDLTCDEIAKNHDHVTKVFRELNRASQLKIVTSFTEVKHKISAIQSVIDKYESFLNKTREFRYDSIKYNHWAKKQFGEISFSWSYKKCVDLIDKIMSECQWTNIRKKEMYNLKQEAEKLECKEEHIDEMLQKIAAEVTCGDVTNQIICASLMADWGTIDGIELCEPDISYIIVEGHRKYYVIFDCHLSCTRYFEGDFHYNGSYDVCVGASVSINLINSEPTLSNIELLMK
ncbi:MAG: hypothetical protein K0R93_687 [Anaerosolibacter sp.]|jgi:hypothetical protein|uniref:hypothetical protein n=1 Tax=Anaerosolibacter sp. TaxID=1872527 RepID=UPI00260CFA3A|nr:hypothetical protein [Anaerosolibacter sp.]MDF2545789.1 hypothetical protein [Anaerosolibacter sp.]